MDASKTLKRLRWNQVLMCKKQYVPSAGFSLRYLSCMRQVRQGLNLPLAAGDLTNTVNGMWKTTQCVTPRCFLQGRIIISLDVTNLILVETVWISPSQSNYIEFKIQVSESQILSVIEVLLIWWTRGIIVLSNLLPSNCNIPEYSWKQNTSVTIISGRHL